jgi:hypothetical protein
MKYAYKFNYFRNLSTQTCLIHLAGRIVPKDDSTGIQTEAVKSSGFLIV